jgi:hypothetical protein
MLGIFQSAHGPERDAVLARFHPQRIGRAIDAGRIAPWRRRAHGDRAQRERLVKGHVDLAGLGGVEHVLVVTGIEQARERRAGQRQRGGNARMAPCARLVQRLRPGKCQHRHIAIPVAPHRRGGQADRALPRRGARFDQVSTCIDRSGVIHGPLAVAQPSQMLSDR